jgi:outer membrane protein assembly factor BamE (lipoprotein component of BamABCDE complex)
MVTGRFAIGAACVLLSGCAAHGIGGLVPGQSTAAQVQALLGAPADKLTAENGDAVWQYPRGPFGRVTYAVRFDGDGTVREFGNLLTEENFSRIKPGETTREAVRTLLGRPAKVTHFSNLQREVWDYPCGEPARPTVLSVQFSQDGIARETLLLTDPAFQILNYGAGRR